MTKYVIANWKSHKTLPEAEKWLEIFCRLLEPASHLKVIIAPSFVFLTRLREMLAGHANPHLALAVQDLSPFPLGSYTGAVAADMVRDLAEYAIIGHGERRYYFHETNQEIANKVFEAAAVNIKPILCVDQPYAYSQLLALDNELNLDDLIIGYSPVEAMGIDIPQPPKKVKRVVKELQAIAPGRPILYGGPINKDNAGTYMSLAGVSGLMVGTASLNPEEFAGICNTLSRS